MRLYSNIDSIVLIMTDIVWIHQSSPIFLGLDQVPTVSCSAQRKDRRLTSLSLS